MERKIFITFNSIQLNSIQFNLIKTFSWLNENIHWVMCNVHTKFNSIFSTLNPTRNMHGVIGGHTSIWLENLHIEHQCYIDPIVIVCGAHHFSFNAFWLFVIHKKFKFPILIDRSSFITNFERKMKCIV